MEALEGLFWGAGLISVIAGLGLLVAPARLRRAYRESPLARFDRTVNMERFLYRHHRPFGLLVAAGAGFSALTLVSLAELWSALQAPIGLMVLLVAANAVALLLGLVIFFRPSLLKRPETIANQWLPEPSHRGGARSATDLYRLRWGGALLFGAGCALLALLATHFS